MSQWSFAELSDWLITLGKGFLYLPLYSFQGTTITPFSLFLFVLALGIAYLVSRYLRFWFDRRFGSRLDRGTQHTITRLIHYTVIVLGVFFAFNLVGINLSSLALLAGGVGIGIGFGLQNLAANFISGLILMFERPISVGDIVTVEDQLGRIHSINLRSTHVTTLDNIRIIIPNTTFVQENVINWSHGDQKVRITCPIGVSYESDVEAVIDLLQEIGEQQEEVLEDPAPDPMLVEYGNSSINFELRVWVGDPALRPQVRHNINMAIHRVFADHDIQIPFPQRDLHVRSTVPIHTRTGEVENEHG